MYQKPSLRTLYFILLFLFPATAFSQDTLKVGFPYSTYFYDNNGRLEKVINTYLAQDTSIQVYVYKDTLLIKVNEYAIREGQVFMLWHEISFEYNKERLIKKITLDSNDKGKWVEEYFYNNEGINNKVLIYAHDLDRETIDTTERIIFYIDSKVSQEFDTDLGCFQDYIVTVQRSGQKTFSYKEPGYNYSRKDYIYDEQGRLIFQKEYYGNAEEIEPSTIIEYFYDTNGKLIAAKTIGA